MARWRHTHTIPVDPSLTPEEAWSETIHCDGEECRSIDGV